MLKIGILQLRMHLFLCKDLSQSLLYLKRWWSWPPPTPPSTTYPSCPTAQHLSSPRHVSELVNWNSRSPEVNSWKIRTDYGEPVNVWLRDSQCSFLRNKSVPDEIGTSEDVVEKNEVLRKLLSVTSFFLDKLYTWSIFTPNQHPVQWRTWIMILPNPRRRPLLP